MHLQRLQGHDEFIWLGFGGPTFAVDPFRIDVGVRSLIKSLFIGADHVFNFEKAVAAVASLVDSIVVIGGGM